MLNSTVLDDLDALFDYANEHGPPSHVDDYTHHEAVRTVVRIIEREGYQSPDEARKHMVNEGWEEESARILGYILDTVYVVLKDQSRVPKA